MRDRSNPCQLEYIYGRLPFPAKCVYGIMFITVGNLARNAIAFGSYTTVAVEYSNNQHPAITRSLATLALAMTCLLYVSWREGGILVNNALAIAEASVLFLIIGLGFAALGGASNFDDHMSPPGTRGDISSYARSLLYVLYSYGGFK
jgi:hypothetical protein